jgi:hypothetical protein
MAAKSVMRSPCCLIAMLIKPLGTMHPIYRTDSSLLPEYAFYTFSQEIHLIIFFGISLAIFVYSSTKCRVFTNVILLGS